MSARSPLLSARAASPRQAQLNSSARSLLSRNDKSSKAGIVVAAATLLLTLLIFLMTYVLFWTQNRDLLQRIQRLQYRMLPWHARGGAKAASGALAASPTSSIIEALDTPVVSMRVDPIGVGAATQLPFPEPSKVEILAIETPDAAIESQDSAILAESRLVDYWISGINGSFPQLEPEELSEYYSIGKTEKFIGDIMQPGVAEEAFRKCSYKKEIIMMCTDVGDIWLEFVFSQIMMMRERGYAHVIVYMDSRDHCERFQHSLFELNPAKSNFWTPLGRLWTMRWMFFAQALRAGYNMLHVDNDVMFTTDIYRIWSRYLKHETFSKFNLMALSSPALIGINCGTIYAQNAHPQGPTAWAAFQVPDRTLRWLDDQEFTLQLLNSTGSPGKLQDIGFEQSVFNDAVWAIVSGKPFFQHSMRPTGGDLDERESNRRKEAWEKYHKKIGPEAAKRVSVQVPESWAPIVKPEFGNTDWNIEMTYYDTQLVSTGANRDQRLGPWPFPEKRGELSTALLKAVASSGQELWPDWEGDSIADQVVQDRREKFLIAPGWLMGAWNKDGHKGYWHVDRPHAVTAHMVGIGGKHQHGKKLGFKVGGWWHYEATRQVYGDGIFFSSTKEQPLPPLLVLDPSIQLKAGSSAEMKGLHLGLILAGHLSNRVWVWPFVDCSSKRFSHDNSTGIWTGTKDTNALFYGGPDNLRCIDLEFTWNYCMEKGMSQPDFEHYRTLEPELTRQTEENTIRIQGNMTLVTKESAEGSTQVVSVDVDELQAALGRMEGQKVVYITAPFAVAQGDTAGWHPGTCVPHCDYEKMKPGLSEELKKFEDIKGCYPFVKMLVDRSEL